jgi:hypothetical protein
MNRAALVITALLTTTRPCSASAGTSTTAVASSSIDLEQVTASSLVGDVLAMDLIGATDLAPVRPGSIKAALTALEAFSKDGKLVPGLAVELTPWSLWVGKGVTHEEYVDPRSVFARMLFGSSLSIATVSRGEDETASIESAAALRVRLWDGSDWRLNTGAIDCVRDALAGPLPGPVNPDDLDAMIVTASTATDYSAMTKKCLEDNVRWNASQGALGVGVVATSPGGSVEQTDPKNVQAFFALSFPLGESGQFTASTRYRHMFPLQETATSSAAAQSDMAALAATLSYRVDSFTVDVNGAFGAERALSKTSALGSVGLEVRMRVFAEVWVAGSATATFTGREAESGEFVFSTSVKWDFDPAADRS